MTRESDTGVGRRETTPAKEELKRRLLALVLAAVLVWYTVLIPSNAPARSYAARVPDDAARDGEVRGHDTGATADARVYSMAAANKGVAFGPVAGESEAEPVEDLDWPEYIYLD
jgi:hypothetical protein